MLRCLNTSLIKASLAQHREYPSFSALQQMDPRWNFVIASAVPVLGLLGGQGDIKLALCPEFLDFCLCKSPFLSMEDPRWHPEHLITLLKHLKNFQIPKCNFLLGWRARNKCYFHWW